MIPVLTFFVPGIPRPAGSKQPYVNKYTGRAAMADASGENGKAWRKAVTTFGKQAFRGKSPLEGPVAFRFVFHMPRPKKHYGTGRNAGKLKAWAPTFHTSPPDATKLVRAVEDALTGVAWADDAEVGAQGAAKVYGSEPGVKITIGHATEEDLK